MRVAYVDTSCLLSVAFQEPNRDSVIAQLDRYDQLSSSDLLIAELLSAASREGSPDPKLEMLGHFVWVFPDRTLSRECRSVLSVGYIKGADLWHLACALFLREKVGNLDFVTLDRNQARLAKMLGLDSSGEIQPPD